MAFTNTSAALRQTGGLIVQRLSQGLQEDNAIASGELDKSINFNVKSSAKKIVLDITMLDYWGAVDTGRRAGKQPPIDKIKEWLTYPNVRDKMRFGQSDASFTESEKNSLAFLIARKIGRQGTKGNNFATNVFTSDLITNELPDIVLNAVIEDADEVLAELLAKFR
jgi:hypothetical protein